MWTCGGVSGPACLPASLLRRCRHHCHSAPFQKGHQTLHSCRKTRVTHPRKRRPTGLPGEAQLLRKPPGAAASACSARPSEGCSQRCPMGNPARSPPAALAALRWRGMRGLSDPGPWSSQPPQGKHQNSGIILSVPRFPYLCKSNRNMPTTWFAASMRRTCRTVSSVLTYREGGTRGHFL